MNEMNLEENQKLVGSWCKSLKSGTDSDLWGQPVEAIEGYERLARELHNHTEPESDIFTDPEKKIIAKVATCLELRSRALKCNSESGLVKVITLEDLKNVEKALKNILLCDPQQFPVNVPAVIARAEAQSPRSLPPATESRLNDPEEDSSDLRAGGTLLPCPIPIEGKTTLGIRIEKIGLKDISTFIDSFITISVKDMAGVDLTASQDTPVSMKKDDSCVLFGVDVYIQKPLEYLPQGFAVFFEFKHYKPKKKTVSTKCWAFIEKDEMKDGTVALELYKKPTDSKRKHINLFTVKQLYLHLKLSLN